MLSSFLLALALVAVNIDTSVGQEEKSSLNDNAFDARGKRHVLSKAEACAVLCDDDSGEDYLDEDDEIPLYRAGCIGNHCNSPRKKCLGPNCEQQCIGRFCTEEYAKCIGNHCNMPIGKCIGSGCSVGIKKCIGNHCNIPIMKCLGPNCEQQCIGRFCTEGYTRCIGNHCNQPIGKCIGTRCNVGIARCIANHCNKPTWRCIGNHCN